FINISFRLVTQIFRIENISPFFHPLNPYIIITNNLYDDKSVINAVLILIGLSYVCDNNVSMIIFNPFVQLIHPNIRVNLSAKLPKFLKPFSVLSFSWPKQFCVNFFKLVGKGKFPKPINGNKIGGDGIFSRPRLPNQ